ncbi:fungal-specific transcription factor domain-containing protein [Aspergillus pseudodeflectus]|uniref:Fungal-specific transcription factor domain-containing protein n=1 Tax=Aspergillus pseudodeflectus TaxID=176178 RepID=A0ABR4J7S9_9EURO
MPVQKQAALGVSNDENTSVDIGSTDNMGADQPRKIHQCHVCQKDFVRLDLLQRHIRRHDRGMSYRNSGGYTTSGRPVGSNRHGTCISPLVPAAGVELRGQSETPGDTVDTPTSRDDQLETPQALVATVGQTSIDALQSMISESRPNETSGVGYLTFFDGSNDATSLTQDLDWLFGVGVDCWDDASASLDRFNNILNPTTEQLPVWSPLSGTSSQGSVSVAVENVTHLVPRQKVLAALVTLPADLLSSSFFDAANLEWFMQSYWDNYNPHFSLLHRPTFSVQAAPPLLLVALLTLGATLSPDRNHYQIAEKIHESLRWLIFTSPDFQAPAPLWVVQALLVVQSYEKMFSTRKLHEISHIFHYSVITLMRRGSSYSPHADHSDDSDTPSISKAWHRWVERELSHRAAYFAFVMDAQHSSIFGHSAALSLTDIHLPLPCADALWEAPTASIWNRERARMPPGPAPSFIPALRALLARQPVPHTYSPFARFVLLHGLLCLTRHMITRDQTASYLSEHQTTSETEAGGSGSVTPEQDSWKDRLDRAIDTWSFSLLSRAPSLCLEAARPLQRIAHVSIHVSLVDFHILAGAPHLATSSGPCAARGRDSAQFARAYKRISAWAHHRNAKRALSHCLLLIQETMFTRTRYAAAEDSIILRPWVLYNTTLVLWAYGAIREGADDIRYPSENRNGNERPVPAGDQVQRQGQWTAEEYLAQMLNGLMGDGSSGDLDQLKGANKTTGLVAAVRDALEGCRWALLEEAKETLGRLSEQTSILLSMGSRPTTEDEG